MTEPARTFCLPSAREIRERDCKVRLMMTDPDHCGWPSLVCSQDPTLDKDREPACRPPAARPSLATELLTVALACSATVAMISRASWTVGLNGSCQECAGFKFMQCLCQKIFFSSPSLCVRPSHWNAGHKMWRSVEPFENTATDAIANLKLESRAKTSA
jgi:hypothetical protein